MDFFNKQGNSASPRPLFGEKVAVIVETRMQDNLFPLILHFSALLGPSWTLVLYTLEKAWEMPFSGPFRQAVDSGRVRIQYLPPDTALTDWFAVSRFLTRPWLWEQVEDSDRMLLFQTDSIICSRSNYTIDDFLEWDYIGAPIEESLGRGYNGGLSIRNPRMILDILKNFDYDRENKGKGIMDLDIEDRWYYEKAVALGYPKLPSEDVAKRFAVETVFYEDSAWLSPATKVAAESHGRNPEILPRGRVNVSMTEVPGGQYRDFAAPLYTRNAEAPLRCEYQE